MINLQNGPKWTPLRAIIVGSQNSIALYRKKTGIYRKIGQTVVSKHFNSRNGGLNCENGSYFQVSISENQLDFVIGDSSWRLVLNGVEISTTFGAKLVHNSAWTKLWRISANSISPIRELRVGQVYHWPHLSNKYAGCGLIQTLNLTEKLALETEKLQAYNKGLNLILDSTVKERDGYYFQGLRDASPR